METTDPVFEKKIKSTGATTGLLYGAISLVLGIFDFYYMTSMASSFWMMVLVPFVASVIVPIVIAVLFSIDFRKKIGGFWSFKQATTGIFIMFFVGYLVSFTGNLIFSKVIEPNMVEKMETAMVNATTAMMQKANSPQDQIDQAVEKTQKSFEDQKVQTAGKIAKSLAIAVIVCFVFALIFGAIFKKDKPLYDTPVDELDASAPTV